MNTMRDVRHARALREERDWSNRRIAEHVGVSHQTVGKWLEPSPERLTGSRWAQRMVELRRVGLSYGAIAAVVNLDSGLSFSRDQVKYRVQKAGVKLPDSEIGLAGAGSGGHKNLRGRV